jgi:hypothetical protein
MFLLEYLVRVVIELLVSLYCILYSFLGLDLVHYILLFIYFVKNLLSAGLEERDIGDIVSAVRVFD